MNSQADGRARTKCPQVQTKEDFEEDKWTWMWVEEERGAREGTATVKDVLLSKGAAD